MLNKEKIRDWAATQHVTKLEELARYIVREIIEDYQDAISIGEKQQSKHLYPWLEVEKIIFKEKKS